jgi:hypothetical protein
MLLGVLVYLFFWGIPTIFWIKVVEGYVKEIRGV